MNRLTVLKMPYLVRLLVCGSITVSVLSCNGSLPVGGGKSPGSNLDVMIMLTKRIAHSFVRDGHLLPSDTCWVQFVQTENILFVENAFLEALRNVPIYVYETVPPRHNYVSVVVQPSRVDVSYERVFREGLFGPKYVSRVVTVELSARIVQQPRGKIHFSSTRSEQWRDTVLVSSVEYLSSPFIKITQASLPGESLLDTLLEPIVVLTATGVVVYLFYTVRS